MRWTACGPKVGRGRQGREKDSQFCGHFVPSLFCFLFLLFFASSLLSQLFFSILFHPWILALSRIVKTERMDKWTEKMYSGITQLNSQPEEKSERNLPSLSVGYEWRWRFSTSSQVGPSENKIPSFPSSLFFLFPLVSLSLLFFILIQEGLVRMKEKG